MPLSRPTRGLSIRRGPQGKQRLAASKSALAKAQASDFVLVVSVCRARHLHRQNKTCKHSILLKSANSKLSIHVDLHLFGGHLKKKSMKNHECKGTLKRIHFKKIFQNLNYPYTTHIIWVPCETSGIDLPTDLFW